MKIFDKEQESDCPVMLDVTAFKILGKPVLWRWRLDLDMGEAEPASLTFFAVPVLGKYLELGHFMFRPGAWFINKFNMQGYTKKCARSLNHDGKCDFDMNCVSERFKDEAVTMPCGKYVK